MGGCGAARQLHGNERMRANKKPRGGSHAQTDIDSQNARDRTHSHRDHDAGRDRNVRIASASEDVAAAWRARRIILRMTT